MSDAILIFTFSPVQSFITEARRASDLYVGSQILVCLAKAAGSMMEQRGTLIYPTTLSDDTPNKLVARVSWEETEAIAAEAKESLLREWIRIADTAKNDLRSKGFFPNDHDRWHNIWAQQVSNVWEIYWTAAKDDGSYKAAYEEASSALDAAKRTRIFDAAEEQGMKDTLSGCRTALHTDKQDAKVYWTALSQHPEVRAAKLRPGGRERLDAIGTVKRFSDLAEKHFPSTSTVASRPFLNLVRGSKELIEYQQTVEELLRGYLYKPNRGDPDWPYDGDLLFMETLTHQRIESSYGLATPDQGWLQMAQDTLREVYKQVQPRPSPYYAIIALDGDNMGKRVSDCMSEVEHMELSCKLAAFAEQVRPIVERQQGSLIYNGGDDVLTMAPLDTVFPFAQALADNFFKTTGGTASAGIAIVHHLFPLGAALEAARQAEQQAKQAGRDAVCVRALKRSDETLEMRSPWKALSNTFVDIVSFFQGDTDGEPLSSKFAYDVLQAAYALPEADEKSRAELKRLLTRHRNNRHPQAPDPQEWAERLRSWAAALPGQLDELGRWLVFARFLAQGGRE